MRTPWQSGSARSILSIGVSALCLSWVALYNRFPLLFWDSEAYIGSAVDGYVFWARSVFYSLFIQMLHRSVSLWPVVFAQALIVSHLLYLTIRVVRGKCGPGPFLLLMVVLSALTSLPWTVGWIMPDIFTPVLVLGLALLGLGLERLNTFERVYVFLLAASAITFHNSHFPLALGLIVTILAVRILLGWPTPPRVRFAPLVLAGPVVLAVAAVLLVNFADRGRWVLVPNSHVFLLARLIEDGPAVKYLESHCPERGFVLCDYLDEMPMQEYVLMWKPEGPFRRAGGFEALSSEAREIAFGTVRTYPLWVAKNALRNAVSQLHTFEIGSGLIPYDDEPRVSGIIQRVFPDSFDAFLGSGQNRRAMPIDANHKIHSVVVVGCLVLLVPLLWVLARRRARGLVALGIVIVGALAGNACVTGALSTVDGRYQARVIWLLAFWTALAISAWWDGRPEEASRGGVPITSRAGSTSSSA